MSRPMNRLSAGQAERLALLLEELGEAQQAIGKILRHGWHSKNPLLGESAPTNRETLEAELGDVQGAIVLLCHRGEIDPAAIRLKAERKLESVQEWMHHQTSFPKL